MSEASGWAAAAGVAFVVVLSGSLYGCPQYWVYQQRLEGEAELAKADYNRQVTVREAQAKFDSSTKLAEAEVERAKGVAAANKIIGDSLKDNAEYLRYLWVNNLENSKATVIYVPTESNLPLLEAGKRPEK
jgi:regulator of protease activity HflC (stomatin/prohibitin superfamily)